MADNTEGSRTDKQGNFLSESTNLKEMIEALASKPSEKEQELLSNENLLLQLKFMDRILNQNTYHKQYILYRNYPEVKIDKVNVEDE